MVGREKYFFIINFNKSTYNGEAGHCSMNLVLGSSSTVLQLLYSIFLFAKGRLKVGTKGMRNRVQFIYYDSPLSNGTHTLLLQARRSQVFGRTSGHAWPKGLFNSPKAVCSVSNFPFFVLLQVHVGCFGSVSMYTRAIIEQGTWAFIKSVFKKSFSTVFWKRRKLIWPDAR